MRRKGIEPLSPAWKAGILPLNQHRDRDILLYFTLIFQLHAKSLKYGRIDGRLQLSECGVTANMSGLGPDDSGFESRHSDKITKARLSWAFVIP